MILRPGIQTLLQDAQRQQFDVVLAEALDRISRDQADVATLFKHLRFAGVPIITLRYALVRTAEKSTPPYTANWARSSDGSKHKPSERLGNAKLPQLSLRECRYRWLRGYATTDTDNRLWWPFEVHGRMGCTSDNGGRPEIHETLQGSLLHLGQHCHHQLSRLAEPNSINQPVVWDPARRCIFPLGNGLQTPSIAITPLVVLYRGRDASYLAPPAQIRTGPIRAYGSHLGCLTAKRLSGHG